MLFVLFGSCVCVCVCVFVLFEMCLFGLCCLKLYVVLCCLRCCARVCVLWSSSMLLVLFYVLDCIVCYCLCFLVVFMRPAFFFGHHKIAAN